jgi:hypothetical protein
LAFLDVFEVASTGPSDFASPSEARERERSAIAATEAFDLVRVMPKQHLVTLKDRNIIYRRSWRLTLQNKLTLKRKWFSRST